MTTEERVARLERENRWMKLGGAVLPLALVAVLFVGAGQEKDKPKVLEEVRAKRFTLIDQAGTVRADMYESKHRSIFTLWDEKRTKCIGLTIDEAGASLLFSDKNREPRAHLGFVEAAGSALTFRDKNGQTRAVLSVFETGPQLLLMDKNGKPRFSLEVEDTGPQLLLMDKNGNLIFKAPK